jgi:hypothetical protein
MTATWLGLTLACVGCHRLLHSNGVTIEVVNSSTQFIRTIEVDFPGGSFGIAALRPAGARSRWVRITASGPLKVIFADDAGEHRAAGMTLNPNDSGAVKLDFHGSGKVIFTDLRPTH